MSKQTLEDYEQMKLGLAAGDPAKCAKATLQIPVTLLDLPVELQEQILVETIVSEIKDRKLFRRGWKKAANQLAERLKTVCPQWNNMLTSDVFRSRLLGILDSFPQEEFCLKVLARRKFSKCVTVTSLDNEIFVLCHKPPQHARIDIYAHSNLKTVKRTIQLAGVTIPWNLEACSMTNCLYILHQTPSGIEIWRISIDGPDVQVSPWITCCNMLFSIMSISADGSLILFQGTIPSTIKVYDVHGSLQHEMQLVNHISYLLDIMSKENGNFVLVKRKSVMEVDREGNTLYEKFSEYHDYIYCALHLYDRIVTIDSGGHVRLFDSEYNLVDVKFALLNYNMGMKHFYRVHYNRKRNEFVAFECDAFGEAGNKQCLTIFNFRERSIPNDGQMCAVVM